MPKWRGRHSPDPSDRSFPSGPPPRTGCGPGCLQADRKQQDRSCDLTIQRRCRKRSNPSQQSGLLRSYACVNRRSSEVAPGPPLLLGHERCGRGRCASFVGRTIASIRIRRSPRAPDRATSTPEGRRSAAGAAAGIVVRWTTSMNAGTVAWSGDTSAIEVRACRLPSGRRRDRLLGCRLRVFSAHRHHRNVFTATLRSWQYSSTFFPLRRHSSTIPAHSRADRDVAIGAVRSCIATTSSPPTRSVACRARRRIAPDHRHNRKPQRKAPDGVASESEGGGPQTADRSGRPLAGLMGQMAGSPCHYSGHTRPRPQAASQGWDPGAPPMQARNRRRPPMEHRQAPRLPGATCLPRGRRHRRPALE